MKKTNVEKWMPCPASNIEYPGLAYLCPLNEVIIAEKLDRLHDVIGIKDNNIGYTIFNNQGQQIFLAVQDKHSKKFEVKIFNMYGNEVIEVKKPLFCFNLIKIWSPPGHFVGSVVQANKCSNTFLVKNEKKNTVLKIQGRGICTFTYIYDIIKNNQQEIEKVGLVKEERRLKEVLDVNNFGISFPVHMDVSEKAVLIGASFLIGYLKYRR